MPAYIYLLIAIVAEVVGTSALKASEGFTRLGPTAVVVVGYGLAFWLLSLTLRTIPVGIAYATWSGLGIVLIAAVGWIAFGQKLDLWAMLGMVLIVAGVLIMNLLSKAAAHRTETLPPWTRNCWNCWSAPSPRARWTLTARSTS